MMRNFTEAKKFLNQILDIKDEPPHGGGEPAIINMGAVVANAIFDATGARVYRLPMTADRVLEEIRAT